jgi:hypothetical protein
MAASKPRHACWSAVVVLLVVGLDLVRADEPGDGWRALFNGHDLAGWDTWLGRANGQKEVIGLNSDPRRVYRVVEEDGQPAIRISGEIFGALTSKEEFGDCHLRLEFKWGHKRWPPRENAVRDSGLLYRCVGPHGAHDGFWMRSLEFQIQEHDTGDFYSVAEAVVDVEGRLQGPKGSVVYHKGGKKFTVPAKEVGGRIIKNGDYEKPTGLWNTLDLLTVGTTSVHMVNGRVNMVLTNARQRVGGREEPLTRGKIQLQSEGGGGVLPEHHGPAAGADPGGVPALGPARFFLGQESDPVMPEAAGLESCPTGHREVLHGQWAEAEHSCRRARAAAPRARRAARLRLPWRSGDADL